MISRLSIQGLAIIDSLSIDFSPGFNVITGETGAGKSILIRALNFLTGGRSGPETVRQGSPQALVTGEFLVPAKHPALAQLEALGIVPEKSGKKFRVILRRQMSAKGRAQAWINDITVTSQALKEIGPFLVDVFAQHENQRLLDVDRHGSYLDEFVAVKEAKQRLHVAFVECDLAVKQIASIISHYYSAQSNRDFVEFRLEEIKKFNPSKEDFDRTSDLCKNASGYQKVREALLGAVEPLEGGEGESLSPSLWKASKRLEMLPESEAQEKAGALKARLMAMASEFDDVVFELRQLLSKYEFDEDGLEKAQGRLYEYQKLFRKHNATGIEELLKIAEDLKTAVGSLEITAEKLEDHLGFLETNSAKALKEASVLTKARTQAATLIKKSVEKELQELSMPGSQFTVDFSPVKHELPSLDLTEFDLKIQNRWAKLRENLLGVGPEGAEKVEFLLASNPGEPILPLARIASGGEISRIMLALKKALTVDADTCVLVFDEIDSGISGRVADVVGKKMRQLAEHFQVLCISHLPQVAVYADAHFLVKKAGKNKRTESNILLLSAKESAEEIARLLSGAEVSKPSLENAQALIARAKKGTSKSASR